MVIFLPLFTDEALIRWITDSDYDTLLRACHVSCTAFLGGKPSYTTAGHACLGGQSSKTTWCALLDKTVDAEC